MKIEAVEIARMSVRKTQPTKVAIGTIESVDNVLVKVVTEAGLEGWGEASPIPFITGDTQAGSFFIAQQLANLLKGRDARALEARSHDLQTFAAGHTSIRSAFDMALHDIAAKSAGLPLYRFLGGEKRTLRTDRTIGWQDSVAATTERAKTLKELGFAAIKVKVGRPGLEDVAHVRAVRDVVGPEVAIRIDGNQGWDLPSTIANITAMRSIGLEYCEQPLDRRDVAGLSELRRRVDVPICADESLFDAQDALRLIRDGAADYLNIKLGKSGGLHVALKIEAIAEAAGKRCMIGCFAESRLGLTAAAHLAAARPNIAFLDLDSAYTFETDPILGGMRYDREVGGLIHLPDDCGLGARPDPTALTAFVKIRI